MIQKDFVKIFIKSKLSLEIHLNSQNLMQEKLLKLGNIRNP